MAGDADKLRVLQSLSEKQILNQVLLLTSSPNDSGTLGLSFSDQVVARGTVEDLVACIEKCSDGDAESLEALCREAGLIAS